MKYEYKFINGRLGEVEMKVNNLGEDGWRLHLLNNQGIYWYAVMEKVTEDDGTKK